MKRPKKTTSTCPMCGGIVPAGVRACQTCRQALTADLRAANGVLTDLAVTLTRQDRMGGYRSGGRSAETPLPYNLAASRAHDELTAAQRAVCTAPVLELAVVERFRRTLNRARTVTDIPAPDELVGVCTCGARLYTRAGHRAASVACSAPGCGLEWNRDAQQDRMREQAVNYVGTAAEVSGVLRACAIPVGTSTVREWARKRWIQPTAQTDEGWPLYRVGEVWEIALAMAQRRKQNAAARSA